MKEKPLVDKDVLSVGTGYIGSSHESSIKYELLAIMVRKIDL